MVAFLFTAAWTSSSVSGRSPLNALSHRLFLSCEVEEMIKVFNEDKKNQHSWFSHNMRDFATVLFVVSVCMIIINSTGCVAFHRAQNFQDSVKQSKLPASTPCRQCLWPLRCSPKESGTLSIRRRYSRLRFWVLWTVAPSKGSMTDLYMYVTMWAGVSKVRYWKRLTSAHLCLSGTYQGNFVLLLIYSCKAKQLWHSLWQAEHLAHQCGPHLFVGSAAQNKNVWREVRSKNRITFGRKSENTNRGSQLITQQRIELKDHL